MKPLIVKCPTCNKSVPWTPEQRWRPFCSERCQLIDLGEWASENRSIPDDTPVNQDDEQQLKRED